MSRIKYEKEGKTNKWRKKIEENGKADKTGKQKGKRKTKARYQLF